MAAPATAMPNGAAPIGAATGQDSQDPLQKFRDLAQQVQQLGQQFPEAAENATIILKEIQKMMVKVAGNPTRNPDKQTPPMA